MKKAFLLPLFLGILLFSFGIYKLIEFRSPLEEPLPPYSDEIHIIVYTEDRAQTDGSYLSMRLEVVSETEAVLTVTKSRDREPNETYMVTPDAMTAIQKIIDKYNMQSWHVMEGDRMVSDYNAYSLTMYNGEEEVVASGAHMPQGRQTAFHEIWEKLNALTTQ